MSASQTERINSPKVVLVEQNRTGIWLAEQLCKNEATVSRWCSNSSQFGNARINDLITGKSVIK